jgi:hypothetical protein
MEMHTASTARADLDDGMDLGFGDRGIGFSNGLGRGLHDHLGWCLLDAYAMVAAVLIRPLLFERGATAARCTRCTGLVGGSQSGQNTTSRSREGPRGGASEVLRF